MKPFSVVVLAAGQGKRMNSNLPKVLHPVGGKPILAHVLETASSLGANKKIVVYGHGGQQVIEAFKHEADVLWVEQKEQLGTGHAVKQAMPAVDPDNSVLILYGDVPLISPESLAPLLAAAENGNVGLLTADMDDPAGLGRIVRNSEGHVVKIIEHKDASDTELAINEINTGMMCVPGFLLGEWLDQLTNDNAQGEYYLTDIIELAVNVDVWVEATCTHNPYETLGINNRSQQAELERYHQGCEAQKLLAAGATLLDPARVDVRGNVSVGRDVIIDINVIMQGEVILEDGVRIGPNTILKDCRIGAGTEVFANCLIEESDVAENANIGPYARLRPGTVLKDGVKIGNFVEVKKSIVGAGSKVNHLSYVGDSELGKNVNVGAGTITCNYDGANKHKTIIEDDVFIGSNTALVAPVTVAKGATVAAGTTLSRDLPAGNLGIVRGQIRFVRNWKRPVKK